MRSRRQFLAIAGTGLGLMPLVARFWRSDIVGNSAAAESRLAVRMTDAEWRAALTPAQYRVLRSHGTEPAFTSPLNLEERRGVFACAACGLPLFSSASRFDSGTGWPSFSASLDNAVGTSVDRSVLMIRIEVHCVRCGGHLGHIFPDGPRPTGLRYCMNGVAMTFHPGA